jgi:hypothetical protein
MDSEKVDVMRGLILPERTFIGDRRRYNQGTIPKANTVKTPYDK